MSESDPPSSRRSKPTLIRINSDNLLPNLKKEKQPKRQKKTKKEKENKVDPEREEEKKFEVAPTPMKKRGGLKRQRSPSPSSPPKKTKQKKRKLLGKKPKWFEKKQKIAMIIQRYQKSKRFQEYLSEYGICYTAQELKGMNMEELEGALGQIRYLIANRSGGSMIAKGIEQGLIQVEKGARPFVNIEGLSGACSNNPEYLDCLEQICVEHDVAVQNVYMRLGWVIASQAAAQIQINKLDIPVKKEKIDHDFEKMEVDDDDAKIILPS